MLSQHEFMHFMHVFSNCLPSEHDKICFYAADFNYNQQILFDHLKYVVKKLNITISHNKLLQLYRYYKKEKKYLDYEDFMAVLQELKEIK